MARTIKRLHSVDRITKPGMHPDGGGLYLQITPSGARSWVYRYMIGRKERYMGLGPLARVTLKAAREMADECFRQRRDGVTIGDRTYFDPLEIRDARRAADRLEAAKAMTFEQCARAYLDDHRDSWRNAKHRQQWENTLATYAYPVFGDQPVQMIDRQLVLKALKPIWKTKPETGNRVRGRIEAVLDWATAGDLRKGDNPARWHGNIANALPRRSKVRKVKHHPALPFAELPAFMAALRVQEGIAARAFEFTILTAARTGETIGATPAEIDRDAKVWTVPAERIKAQREHRVPLAPRVLALLEEMPGGPFIFPGATRGKPLSNMAMLGVLDRMRRGDITVHGFRSTFKDWASERTNFPGEVSEAALAHIVGDKVEAAYRRGTLFEKRRRLMEAWAEFCASKPASGNVVPIRAVDKVVGNDREHGQSVAIAIASE
jgi:integrase